MEAKTNDHHPYDRPANDPSQEKWADKLHYARSKRSGEEASAAGGKSVEFVVDSRESPLSHGQDLKVEQVELVEHRR